MAVRTDLALEEKEDFDRRNLKSEPLTGVVAKEEQVCGLDATVVEITNEAGSKALHKPMGTYVTLELSDLARKKQDSFPPATQAIAQLLGRFLKVGQGETVLVVGLGNKAITPDAIGPLVTEQMFVTRHLKHHMPDVFGAYRPTCVMAPGVLGMTGMESAEVVKAVTTQVQPSCVVVVDALASRDLGRVCTTIQMTDSGIAPGSGVQNARMAFTTESLGVPVVALGVPTVVEVETIAEVYDTPHLASDCDGQGMIVTLRDIDARVLDISKAIAYGINLALHPQLTLEDIAYFVE